MSKTFSDIPVVEFRKEIIGAPIVGALDSQRTQELMEQLLEELYQTKARVVIIDISGVPTVDTEVSKNLTSLMSAIDLMGSMCIVSGVRPDVAQTVVDLGINLSGYNTTTSLSQALEEAYDHLGLEVREKQSKPS